MGVYTGTGDLGETCNLNGERVSKNDILIHLEGAADELNSHLGLVKAMLPCEETRQFVEKIQKNIMKLMSHISDNENGEYFLSGEEVTALEREIDRLSEEKQALHELVIPGKNITEAQIHIARTAARRAERLFFAVNERQPLCPDAGAYLNRLSDYLFILSQMA